MAKKYSKKAQKQGQARDARAQARNAAQRPLGQEGDEPQAGDRDRPVRGASRRREGAAQAQPPPQGSVEAKQGQSGR